jgi:catechol 2,3-dioxygenase
MSIISPVLHHVTMRTSRLAEMVAWYATVLGARVMFRDENAAWMSNDSANHRIAFLSAPGVRDDPDKHSHNAMHHSAFEYGAFDDLMASYGRLRDEGITPSFCLDHTITFSIYYKDPEGNFVELQTDGFGDWRRSSEFISGSPDFAANPIGFFFDADKVYQAHRAGVAFAAIQKAVRSGAFAPAEIPGIGLG